MYYTMKLTALPQLLRQFRQKHHLSIKTFRRKHCVSLNQLSKLSGISRRTLIRIEAGFYSSHESQATGHRPALFILFMLTFRTFCQRVFEISVKSLIWNQANPNLTSMKGTLAIIPSIGRVLKSSLRTRHFSNYQQSVGGSPRPNP